jgi:hypothetical protein
MPIPKPNDGELQDEFMQRCMSNDTMVSEYPDEKQRIAICMQQSKKDGDNVDKIKKVLNFEVKQIGLDEERTLGFIGSTEAMDRDGDIIEAFGWDLTDYQKNPVIMGFHEYDKFPYAKSVNTYIDYTEKKLKFDVKFPTISELTSFPGNADMIAEHAKNVDMAYNMYKNGYMSAVSVGFVGVENEPMYGEDGNYKGRRYKKQSLLELSLVPVPSNPTALMEARSKGLISDKELKILQIDKETIIEDPPEQDLPEQKILLDAEQKVGASISGKNMAMMAEAMGHMQMAIDKMKEMMGMYEEEGMSANCTASIDDTTIKNELNEEIKTALEEIKAQVLLLSQKDAPKIIDLDAIEYTPLQKDAPQDELNIEPEVLKNMIKEIISNNLQGGIN